MFWRLVSFIVIFGVFIAFIGFNLENKCDINVGFHVFRSVPVFLTVFLSFLLGILSATPVIIGIRAKRRAKKAAGLAESAVRQTAPKQEKGAREDFGSYGVD
jgi:hypothetical protein